MDRIRPCEGEAGRGRRRAVAAALAHAPGALAGPNSGGDRDRLAGRLLHLRRGGSLAGQRHQRGRATATAPTARRTTARPPSASTTRRRVYGADRRRRLRPLGRGRDQRAPRSPVDQKINLACSGADAANIFREEQGRRRSKRASRRRVTSCSTSRTPGTSSWSCCRSAATTSASPTSSQACATAYLDGPGSLPTTAQQAGARRPVPSRAMQSVGRGRSTKCARSWPPPATSTSRFVVQSYPVGLRAREREPLPRDRRAQREGIGGCPSYDADADWARDSVVNQIATGLECVSVQKGVQCLDLRDAFQGREICSRSTSQASVGHPPSPTTSE